MMLGIYYEVVQRWIHRQPSRVWAFGQIFSESRFDPETGSDKSVRIPESLSYTAVYDDGLQLTGLMTGMELGSGRDEYAICGSKGTLRLDLQTGTLFQTLIGETQTIIDPKSETIGSWNVEGDFIDSIRSGSPVTLTSFQDGLAYMKFTDAVKASFDADGAWQSV